MKIFSYLACFVFAVKAGPATESFKNHYCTDPRTMKKHAAYTEWADAYSCTRHRCQPGGRNLAIYTVGCKRVEPPESAIECEEVVEDTNMQFPYCCTRLRCLVVVRGEVWTRVLGQPWETLPAAPWSHMYKMKKPPPTDSSFLPKTGEGPIYELAVDTDDGGDKVLRAAKATTVSPDCDKSQRAQPSPDIVIALATNKDEKLIRKPDNIRKRVKKTTSGPFSNAEIDDDVPEMRNDVDIDDIRTTEKSADSSDEKYYVNGYGVTQNIPPKNSKSRHIAWTEIPPSQWNEHEPSMDAESPRFNSKETSVYHAQESQSDTDKKEEKPANLQALVDAIGTRMRDIESVVQRMSQKVHRAKPEPRDLSNTASIERSDSQLQTRKHLEPKEPESEIAVSKVNHLKSDGDNYVRSGKRLRVTTEATSEVPIFVEDSNLNGYLSDVGRAFSRRASPPKEPSETYMAPVDNVPKTIVHALVESSGEIGKSKKKHMHKKKRPKVIKSITAKTTRKNISTDSIRLN